jgi:hypothetical protein
VGREELLEELDARLASEPGRGGPRVVALCGLGGAGKTSIAIEYAHLHLAEVATCWQFSAEDETVLAAEFAVLAAELGVRDVTDVRDPVASVHGVLARQESGWLLVFDNAPDLAAVEQFLPPAGPGRVLVTTQSQHWPPGQVLDVPVLGTEVATAFLVTRTGEADRAMASELAAELGGLPLALEQAAAYMQATGTSLARYLPLFRARHADLLARGEAPGHREHVAATLSLALNRLEHDAPASVGLLRLLAFLAPEPVPLELLLDRPHLVSRLGAETTGLIEPLLADPVAVDDAVAALRRYSLVTPTGDGQVQVHRLVQAITRAQLTGRQADRWRTAAESVISEAIPADTSRPEVWQMCGVLLPHALAVLSLTSDDVSSLADYLGKSGSYQAARDLLKLIVEAHRKNEDYGPEHPYTLASRGNLAIWTGQAGDVVGARDQLADLLPITERILGPEHPDTLRIRSNMGTFTREAGDLVGARDQLADLVPITERILGPEHPDTIKCRCNLAFLTGETGDAASARDQFADLLPITERILGTEHSDTLSRRCNLGEWTGRAGDAASARDQFADLLPLAERILGPEHPDILSYRGHLAYWTGDAGDAASARDQFADLLPLAERILGPEHPTTLRVRDGLAHWTGEAGDMVGARDQLADLLPITERILGPEHPSTIARRDSLAYWAEQANEMPGQQRGSSGWSPTR